MVRSVGDKWVPHAPPSVGVDQCWMLPEVELALVCNLTDVDRVREQLVEVPPREGFAAALGALRRRAALCREAEAIGLLLYPAHAAEVTIESEDTAYRLGLGRVDDEGAVGGVIAERHIAAHPHPLLLGGGDLVTDAFAGDLPLELTKG